MSVTKGAFRTFFAHVSPLRLQQFIGLGWSLQGVSCTFYLGLKKYFHPLCMVSGKKKEYCQEAN